MPALYVMIPVALIIVAIAIYIFNWAVNSGQFDDMEGPAHSILFDDEDPMHKAGVEKANESHNPTQSDTDSSNGSDD